jgi:phytoene dehydrogenase-like protein
MRRFFYARRQHVDPTAVMRTIQTSTYSGIHAMEDKQKKMIIIGGGIAGLCAGIYARKNGFDTVILELHEIAGGLATGWTRQGYTFENCVHWLVGSKEGADLNDWWHEVFDIDKINFYDSDIQSTLEGYGTSITIYRNNDRLERELLAKAPEDADAIRSFMRDVRKLTGFKIPGGNTIMEKALSYLRAVPYLPLLSRWSKITTAQYGARFKNPLLRTFFGAEMGDLSAVAILFSIAWMNSGNGGYPVGGSLRMIGLIEESYRKLGGEIRFNSRVIKIIVKDGAATGVLLDNGERIDADVVVSAADGHATLFDMLGEKYLDERTKQRYREMKPFPSYVQVSFGFAREFKGEPELLSRHLDTPIHIDPQTDIQNLTFRIFHYDPTFAPPGKTAIVSFIATYDYEHWVTLSEKEPAKYETEKKRIANAVLEEFEKRYPGSKATLEVTDVATPATVIRYTNNWKGSMEGWLITPKTGMKQLPTTLPGLKDFYMVGQWISPGGGLPAGLMTARNVLSKISKE